MSQVPFDVFRHHTGLSSTVLFPIYGYALGIAVAAASNFTYTLNVDNSTVLARFIAAALLYASDIVNPF